MAPRAEDGSGSRPAYGSPAYCWYVLLVLSLVHVCHAVDRVLPNILVEPVKHEFNLNDGQLGLFTGLAYGVAYSAAVLPAGWFADRTIRRNLLAAALVIWSILTAVGGITRSYAQLLVARAGVGAAEAATVPVAMPMLSDVFPANRRSLVIGIFYTAVPVGALLANWVGAVLAAEHGWRMVFFIAGVPGVLLAILLVTTVREPRRGGTDDGRASTEAGPPARFSDGLGHYIRNPGLIYLMLGAVIIGVLNIVLNAWMSSFFIRVHGLSLPQTGLILGLGAGLCGIFSPLAYGGLTDRLAGRNAAWPLWLAAAGAILSLLFTQLQLFVPSVAVAVVGFIVADFLRMGYTAPLYAVLMNHTPARVRSSVMSILMLATVLMGFGVGPALTGVLSEYFGGGANIKYALAFVSLLFIPSAILLILAERMLRRRRAEAVAA